MIRFKCWFFGHKPQRAWLAGQVHLPVRGVKWEQWMYVCARCHKALALEWEEVR